MGLYEKLCQTATSFSFQSIHSVFYVHQIRDLILGLFLKDLDFCEGMNLPLERNESLCCEEDFG